jgi:hypothetical protein
MSAWPLISSFSKMLQNPRLAFRDPVLRECKLELTNLGQPKPRSGNFATVYRAYRADGGEFAIRIFNRRIEARHSRYRAVSQYLETHPVACLVGFEYREKGIRASDGKMYPMITMDWVPGVTLFEWARDRARERYQEALSIGADAWLQLVRDLATANVVHGDLQHGNVMVTHEGFFNLVDYDCMGVPELMGMPNLEVGLTPYQHPGRNADTLLNPGLDNYSSLVIYVALRALAAEPGLWDQFVDQPEHDKLLFRESDFQNPQASGLYYRLLASPDEQVRDLAHYLFELTNYRIEDIPPIDEVLLWCNSLQDLITAKDWDMALALVNRMGEQEQIDPAMEPLVQQARTRVAARDKLQEALASGDERRVIAAYKPQLLDDFPAAADLVIQARETPRVIKALELLDAAILHKDWELFRETWLAHQAVLNKRPSARRFKTDAKRVLTSHSLRKLLADPKIDDDTILKAWEYLQSLGGHPSAEDLRPSVDARLARRGRLQEFQAMLGRMPAEPTLKTDRELLAAWDPQISDPSGKVAAPLQAARTRVEQMETLAKQAKQCTLQGEESLSQALTKLPRTYHPQLIQRAEVAKLRLETMKQLGKGVSRDSDVSISVAMDRLNQLKALSLLSPEQQSRVELAQQRRPLIETLRKLLSEDPNTSPVKLLEVWDDALLSECRDVADIKPKILAAKSHAGQLQLLKDAIDAGDLAAADDGARSLAAEGHSLPKEVSLALKELKVQKEQQRLRQKQSLVSSLLENDRRQFYAQFDSLLLSDICQQSPHHQPVVATWLESEVLPLEKIGLSLPKQTDSSETERSQAVEIIDGKLRVRWQWPDERFSRRCVLTLTTETPREAQNPDDVTPIHREDFTLDRWRQLPGYWEALIEDAWQGATVTVWAIVDLDFAIFSSHPLILGKAAAPAAQQKRRWGLFRG